MLLSIMISNEYWIKAAIATACGLIGIIIFSIILTSAIAKKLGEKFGTESKKELVKIDEYLRFVYLVNVGVHINEIKTIATAPDYTKQNGDSVYYEWRKGIHCVRIVAVQDIVTYKYMDNKKL